MKRRLFVILALILFMIPLKIASADTGLDDKGQPNDPSTNIRANACYSGGAMEGKCDTAWAWTCGWYMIRYQHGIFSRHQVPAVCASLLPAESSSSKTYPTAGCVYIANDLVSPVYLNFNGGNFVPGVTLYTDAKCTVFEGSYGLDIVYAPTGAADALAICKQHGSYTTVLTTIGVPLVPGIYRCV